MPSGWRVDPPSAKELRLFGLADWTVDRCLSRRRRLFDLQYAATRLRERSVLVSLVVVGGANALFFLSLANAGLSLDRTVVFAQVAVGSSAIAFGGVNWALDGAAAPVAAVQRLEPAVAPAGALSPGSLAAAGLPASEVRLRSVGFRYPRTDRLVFDGLDLTIPAGSSMAIVGQNGAGKTTLAKLLCRLYEPVTGTVEVDGTNLRELDVDSWRSRITAVFQDFVRFELSLRDNVDPGRRATDEQVLAALADAGADGLADLDTPLSRSYRGGTDLSGGQWQRVALARALCAVRLGAGLVLLDEPTAQLDVRGEAEIFERIPAATRGVTTVLVSHRFSTVRQADRICVLEQGRRRARQPRRAHGPRRPLPHDVRPAGDAVRAGPGGRRCPLSVRSDGVRRRPAAGAVLDDAVAAAGLPARAAAAGSRLRPDGAGSAAGRADRAVAAASQLRRAAPRPQSPGRGRPRPRPVGDGDLAAEDGEHPRAAAVPRQGVDRARVARRATAGRRHHHRPPGTARPARPAVRAAQPDLRAGPHVHVGLLHRRLAAPAGRHRRAPDVGLPAAAAARRVRGPDRAHLDLAAGRRAGHRGGLGGAPAAGRAPVRDGHDGRAR